MLSATNSRIHFDLLLASRSKASCNLKEGSAIVKVWFNIWKNTSKCLDHMKKISQKILEIEQEKASLSHNCKALWMYILRGNRTHSNIH
jgi:hypothetical protein